jgi:ABC-type Mn2+/Zn2+ transport system ATPase subunit
LTTLIQIEGAAFGYGERPVLAGLDVRLRRGTLVGVAGPNGSGKSTLVRGVLGLLKPLQGRVLNHARSLGYVPQRDTLDALYPLTALEVVRMGAYGRLGGLRLLRREERQRARQALERVGLAGEAQRLFARLSGGQRQRILLARALVMAPEVLVLDEPTSGVDADAEAAILQLLGELREDGLAILFVSHRLEALCRVADELLWVDRGGVRLEDPRQFEAHCAHGGAGLVHRAEGSG